MLFSFKVKGGGLQSIVAQMYEIQMKAIEVGADIKINKDHLLDEEPFIIVSCIDKQKGMMLLKKTGQEVPRFSII
jgi:hypothetical protein